jgi:acetolactate synthase-1/2/3 large subunit
MTKQTHISGEAGEKSSGANILADALVQSGVNSFFIEAHQRTETLCRILSGYREAMVIQPISDISCVPMADVCARYTGKPAAAITIGAGHCLNQIMGITTAWGDKSPVISIAIIDDDEGAISPVFDRDKTDLAKAFLPVTIYRAEIHKHQDIEDIIRRAVRESQSGKGGPVHLEIKKSLLDKPVAAEISVSAGKEAPPSAQKEIGKLRADPSLLREAIQMLRQAARPIIFAGGGVTRSGACNELHEFAEMTGIPLLSSLGAMDLLDMESPCYVGPSSYLAGEAFHAAVKKADVCLALGTCFSELDGFGLPPIWSKKIKFIQVNIDHNYIALNPPADIAIVADAREALRQMIEICKQQAPFPNHAKWIAGLKKKNAVHYERVCAEAKAHEANAENMKLHPFTAFSIIRDFLIDDNTIGVMDGGNTALWGGMIICAKGPGRFHFPTGMATLGVGVPMAIALKASTPGKRVILVAGDGSFLFNVQELELIRRYNLPIVIVINNDSSWNMMRLGEIAINKAISAPLPQQDYSKIAESYGIKAFRVSSMDDWNECAAEVTKYGGPVMIELITDSAIQPDSIVSFIRVELMGSIRPPWKKLRRIYQSELNPGRNTLNLLKYLIKTI